MAKTEGIVMVEKETRNTYEAAFYYIHGAKLLKVRLSPVPKNKKKRKGFSNAWNMTLSDIPEKRIREWETGKAKAYISDFKNRRRALKRDVKRYLQRLHEW